ncbi:unnamed protein product [Phytophthora lilii]|uniref:Unnamed protein product n=1 Tax=Phytophthora lilii TaxID=2077276 RepID=A0A9W6TN41_9STRA|nr:unnamed protein product [Phytophthora lilii]
MTYDDSDVREDTDVGAVVTVAMPTDRSDLAGICADVDMNDGLGDGTASSVRRRGAPRDCATGAGGGRTPPVVKARLRTDSLARASSSSSPASSASPSSSGR